MPGKKRPPSPPPGKTYRITNDVAQVTREMWPEMPPDRDLDHLYPGDEAVLILTPEHERIWLAIGLAEIVEEGHNHGDDEI